MISDNIHTVCYVQFFFTAIIGGSTVFGYLYRNSTQSRTFNINEKERLAQNMTDSQMRLLQA